MTQSQYITPPPSLIARATSKLDLSCYAVTCLLLFADAWRLVNAVAASSPATPGLGLDQTIICTCFLLLAALGWQAWRRGEVSVSHAFAIGATSGALLFAGDIGTTILDPTHIAWVLQGDWATHYAGWAMFRNTPWTWPPGAQPGLMYPVGSAILFSDSLPLLALLFKPFTAWLPDPFQYTGIWFACSCILQGAFAAVLVQRWTRNIAVIAAAAALFLYAPVLLSRLGHVTLTAHWLILASLWLYYRPEMPRKLAIEAWPWWLLAGIGALVIPYLAMMVFAILAAYWVRRTWVDHERRSTESALVCVIAAVLMAALWWLSGAWIIKYQNGGGGIAYGVYTFNLLGFFNPAGRSRLLPSIPMAHPEQYEGYAYLGLGVLALLAILSLEMLIGRRRLRWPRQHWPLAVVVLLLVAYAASTVLTLGPWTLIDHQVKSPILATFRGSGRFIWVAYYLIVLGAIVLVVKRFPGNVGILLVTAAVTAQAWDLSIADLHYANLRSGVGWPVPEQSLRDPRWDELASGRHHVTLVPPAPCGVQPGSYVPFQLLAAKHVMSLNSGYVNRWDPAAESRYCNQLAAQLANGSLSNEDVYVVGDTWLDRFEHAGSNAHCQMLDGFRACVLDLPPTIPGPGQ